MNQEIQYYKSYDSISSSLVYPLDSGYYYDMKLDNDWVEFQLRMQYNVRRIDNKYAVELKTNSGNVVLVVNHDGNHYTIYKPKPKIKAEDIVPLSEFDLEDCGPHLDNP